MNHDENKHAHEHMHSQEHSNKCGKCGKHHKKYTKLCPVSLGFASGLVYSLSILIIGWLGASLHMPAEIVHMVGAGSIGSGIFGFVAGFVSGLVFGLVYNACLCCWKCRSKCSKCGCRCCKC